MTQRQKVVFISIFVAVGFLASTLYHYYLSHVKGLNYFPYNTFLFSQANRFADLIDNFNIGRNPYGEISAIRATFPFFVLLCRILFLAGNRETSVVLYLVLFLYILGAVIFKYLKQETLGLKSLATCILLFCSYPVLISLDRANFENIGFLLIFLSVFLIQRKRYVPASLAMGIAIALKPYSFFFLPLFLIEGEIVPVILACVTALLISIVSLLLLPVPIVTALHTLQENLTLYNELYVVRNEGLYFSTSIFSLMKLIIFWLGSAFHWFSNSFEVLKFIRAMMRPYFLITNLAFIGIVVVLLIYKTALWKKIAILACCLTLFPYVGSAYRLLYLFIPMLLFLTEQSLDLKDRFYVLMFSLYLIPVNYFHFVFDPIYIAYPGETQDSVLFQPIVLVILLGSLLWDVIYQHELNEPFIVLVKRVLSFMRLINATEPDAPIS